MTAAVVPGSAIALIGARGGSSVLNKNIRVLAGRPILAYAIKAAHRVRAIGRTIVSTDSALYKEIAESYGGEVPFLRPTQFARHDSVDYEFVEHALQWLAKEGSLPEFVVHLRPTTPLRTPIIVEEALAEFRASRGSTSLRSVHEMAEPIEKCFHLTRTGELRPVWAQNAEAANGARQGFPPTWIANGYVDVLRTEHVLDTKTLHGDKVVGFVTPRVTEFDSEEDFEHLEFEAAKYPSIVERLFNEH